MSQPWMPAVEERLKALCQGGSGKVQKLRADLWKQLEDGNWLAVFAAPDERCPIKTPIVYLAYYKPSTRGLIILEYVDPNRHTEVVGA